MWKHVASNVMSLFVLAGILLLGLITLGIESYRSSGPLTEARFFNVNQGDSLRVVSESLAEEGIISSAMLFRVGADYAGRAQDLKFGTYEIPASASMADVLNIVTAGGRSVNRFTATFVVRARGAQMRVREQVPGQSASVEIATFNAGEEPPQAYLDLKESGQRIAYQVNIPPGLTSWQIVEALKLADFLTGDIAELPAEGSLAPNTYERAEGSTRQSLVDEMADAQLLALQEIWAARADNLPILTPAEALTLASIIEKETAVAEERGLVSSVFINRLNQGMRLQTDPTVIYGVTGGRAPLDRGLRRSELRGATPYNTYVISGLPPGPIANPGRAALEAAVNPDTSDYIFFVADGTGGHAFATTLAEHNQNVARWREIEAGLATQDN